MSRQKLFEVIQRVTGFMPLESDMDEIQNACEEIILKNQWIDINNEKPNNGSYCLVYLYNCDLQDNWTEMAFFIDGSFYGVVGKPELITHWMYAPIQPF